MMSTSLPRILLLGGAVAGSVLCYQQYHRVLFPKEVSIQSKLDIVEAAFQRGVPLRSQQDTEGLCGRVMRIGPSGYPERMGGKMWKPYAFVMGGDGLYKISQCQSDYDKMLKLGFEAEWIKFKLQQDGTYFVLTIFPEFADNYQCRQATWDGVFGLIEETEPEVFERIKKYRHEIMNRSCAEIEAECDWDFLTVNQNNKDPRHLTGDKFLAMDPKDITIVHARFLLYSWALNRQFDGGGYTMDKNGTVGVKEYLMTNVKMNDVDDMRIIKLDVVPTPQ